MDSNRKPEILMTEDPLNTSLKPRVKAQPPHHSNYSNFHAMLFAQNFNTDLIRACLKLQAFELGRKQSKKPTQSLQKKTKTHYHEVFLVVVSKSFLFSTLFGEDEPILTSIFFRWVETTNWRCFWVYSFEAYPIWLKTFSCGFT